LLRFGLEHYALNTEAIHLTEGQDAADRTRTGASAAGPVDLDVATDVGPRAALRRRARLRHVWRVAIWFGWIWPASLRREANGVWRTHGALARGRWRWRAVMMLSRFMAFAWPRGLAPGRWGHTCRTRPLLIVWWPGLGEGLFEALRRTGSRTGAPSLDWAVSPIRLAMARLSRLWARPAYRRGAFAGLACLAAAGFFLLRKGDDGANDAQRSQRMARALAWRVGLSVVLFLCLLLAWKLGYIQPTGWLRTA